MRLSDFGTVVFDLDDTLYLERDYVRSGFFAIGTFLTRQWGWSPRTGDAFATRCLQLFREGRRGDILDATLQEFQRDTACGTPPDGTQALVAVYRHHAPKIDLQPDARRLLSALSGHPNVWIITDGYLAGQRAKIASLDLTSQVRKVICTDQWGRRFWKPHPRSFRYVQRVSGAVPSDCVYLGDNPNKDFTAPRQLGWTTVRIRRTEGLYANQEAAHGHGADAELTSLWPLCQQLPWPLQRALSLPKFFAHEIA